MKVYFIPGLAADSRVFRHIHLPGGYEPVFLDWIEPLNRESLANYALRLSEAIEKQEPFILVGLSMGGMIATEIYKQHKPIETILISSVTSHRQFPQRFRIAYFFRLHKIIPPSFFKSASIVKRIFTNETAAEKRVLVEVIKDCDPGFIRWGLGAILEWKNDIKPEPLWHIHGTHDEILPYRYTHPTHTVKKGTHLMVLSRSAEMNRFFKEVLPVLPSSY